MPFYQLDLWELKTAFAGVFTASRVSQAAFRTASVPTHILCASPRSARPSTCLSVIVCFTFNIAAAIFLGMHV